MFRTILAGFGLVLFVSVAQAAGFADCPQFFVGGHPPAVKAEKARELCFSHFAVLHSGVTRTPVFSAERLTPEDVAAAKQIKRKDRFFADRRLPEAERAELADYKKSGYDKGHMSPDKDQPDETSMEQSFSLANMVPQAKHNNEVVWKGYETALRKYVERSRDTVYVITGPIFSKAPERLNSRVAIPSQIYKLVYDPTAGRAWAYWTDNTDDARSAAPISYQELTQRLGYELLPGLKPNT
jgi:endonuclease G